MTNPTEFQFDLPENRRPNRVDLNVEDYPGLSAYIQQRSGMRRFHPVDGIRAVVIHATAGWSSADAVGVMAYRNASFHYLVPDEDEPQHSHFVWRVVPEELAAYHVRNLASHTSVWGGNRRVNHWSLGIEIVNSQTNADTFSDWQIRVAADIVRKCWQKYPNLLHVVSHARLDPGRRTDPGTLFPWDQFRDYVLSSEEPAIPALVGAAEINTDRSPGKAPCCMPV